MGDIRDARIPCKHGNYRSCGYSVDPDVKKYLQCPGGRPVTVNDLDVLRAAYMTGQYTSGIEELHQGQYGCCAPGRGGR